MEDKPGLYGIANSNRDFTTKEAWGKNQFNSSFPAALTCFLHSRGLKVVYLNLDKELHVSRDTLGVDTLFGIDPGSEDLFFSFESTFAPYEHLLSGSIPGIDLVLHDTESGSSLRGLEIKLTALPDYTTCELSEEEYGTEIVVRTPTIVYLACSIAVRYKGQVERLRSMILDEEFDGIEDWTQPSNIVPLIPKMTEKLRAILIDGVSAQEPLVCQPIWKTLGKSPKLADECLDVFVWSDLAFSKLFLDRIGANVTRIQRPARTAIWVFRMLYDFATRGRFYASKIIDELSYNTLNDKAFACSGAVTHPYMKSDQLTRPRVVKADIKRVILGGGQKLLSPERRFDAIICNSPELFE